MAEPDYVTYDTYRADLADFRSEWFTCEGTGQYDAGRTQRA